MDKGFHKRKEAWELPIAPALFSWALAVLGLSFATNTPWGAVVSLFSGAALFIFTQGAKPENRPLTWGISLGGTAVLLGLVGALSPRLPGGGEKLAQAIVFFFLGTLVWWIRDPSRTVISLILGLGCLLVKLLDLQGAALIFGHFLFWPLMMGLTWWIIAEWSRHMTGKESLQGPSPAVAGLAAGLVIFALIGAWRGDSKGDPGLIHLPGNQQADNKGPLPSGDTKDPIDPNTLDSQTRDRLANLPDKLTDQLPPNWRDAAKKIKEEEKAKREKNGDAKPPMDDLPGQNGKDQELPNMDQRDEYGAVQKDENAPPEKTNGENNTPVGMEYPGGSGDNFNFGGGMDSREGRNKPSDGTPGAGSGLDREEGMESTSFPENGRTKGGTGSGAGEGSGDGKPGGGSHLSGKDQNKPDSPVRWEGVPEAGTDGILFEYEAPKATRFRTQTLGHFDGKRWSTLEAMDEGNKHYPKDINLTVKGDAVEISGMPDVNRTGIHLRAVLTLKTSITGNIPHPAGIYNMEGKPVPTHVTNEDILHFNGWAQKGSVWTMDFEKRAFFAGQELEIPESYFEPYLDAGHLSDKAAWLAHTVAGNGPAIAQALAIEGFLHNRYGYNAQVPPVTDGTTVDMVLFQRHEGYCAQFAEIMALMAREIGLPSRVVVGFAPGSYRGKSVYRVTGGDAHAWTEVYIPGAGWLEFDATPPKRQMSEDPLAGLPAYPGPGWRKNLPKKKIIEKLPVIKDIKKEPFKALAIGLIAVLLATGAILYFAFLKPKYHPAQTMSPEDLGKLAERLEKDFAYFRSQIQALGLAPDTHQTPREIFSRTQADRHLAARLQTELEEIFYGGKSIKPREYVELRGNLLKLLKRQKDLGPAPKAVDWDQD